MEGYKQRSPFNAEYWRAQDERLKETDLDKAISQEIRRSFLLIYQSLLARHKDTKFGGFKQW